MKTFNQYTKSKELTEYRDARYDWDLGPDHIQYHISELLGDLLKIMWAVTKFVAKLSFKGATALYKRYSKEARAQRKELRAINAAIKTEKEARARALIMAAYQSAAIQAENEKQLLKNLSVEDRKKYARDIRDMDSVLDHIIDRCKMAIKNIKANI